MSDSVGQYLNEIGLVPLLTAEEERELSKLVEAGFAARERVFPSALTIRNRSSAGALVQARSSDRTASTPPIT